MIKLIKLDLIGVKNKTNKQIVYDHNINNKNNVYK